MKTETGKLVTSVQQCGYFLIGSLKRKIITKLKVAATRNGMAEEKQIERKAIVTLSTKRILVTALQKQERSVTEKCSDRNLVKLTCTDMEKHMALFAEKLGDWSTQPVRECRNTL
eukprot:4721186-Ditylum_brightwellii.AAC.1